MNDRTDPGRELRTLGAAERRRLRRGLVWTVAATCAAFAFLLLVWEGVTGGTGLARAAGYAAAALLGTGGLALACARWLRPAAGEREVAERLERLFPQARGRVRAALGPGGSGLAAAVANGGREWLARRGSALDAAFSEGVRRRSARMRRMALGLSAALVLAVIAAPAAGRRVVRAILDPATLWAGGASEWRVTPGDASIEYGASVTGAARYEGPLAGEVLVLEWREGEGAWRADTLGSERSAEWRWPEVAVERRYRLRYGRAATPEYTIEVGDPLVLLRIEAREPGEGWTSLAGRTVTAGAALEVRGEANGPIERAFVRDAGGRETALEVAGATFRGPAGGLPVGTARILVYGEGGVEIEGPTFLVAPRGSAFVEVLRPAENPTTLAAESAWLEVRAGAPAGLAALSWETSDGRTGSVAAVVGARDTVVTAVAALAGGHLPGDTIRYRLIARPVSGPAVATPWRIAIVASAAVLRAAAEEERAAAGREVADALEAARRAAEERGDALGTPADDAELDRRLAEAADSLARALDRTLADPEIDPELAARLEGYRQQLEGVAEAVFDPPRGMPADPAAEAEARAAVLEAISERLDRIERSIARQAAADSLEALADAQSELADETRAAAPVALERSLAARQEALAEAALEAAGELSEEASEGLEEALAEAAGEMRAGDPAAAARAQDRAAAEMMQAAGQTRSEEGPQGPQTSHQTALDRAGAESLFLAERQRELAERHAGLGDVGERAARLARQRVVTGGLDRALGTMVEAIGGRPASMELAMRMAQAVYATRQAETSLERAAEGPGGAAAVRGAAEEAATALALLARGLFLPQQGGGGMGGSGQAGDSGQLSQQLQQMAAAQAAMADALASGEEPAGGNAEAAAAEQRAADQLREMGEALEEEGVEARSIESLARAVEEASTRLERGLEGARTESDLRSLARRLADLGRMIDSRTREERTSETARSFVPAAPPPLDARVTAAVLDPAAVLAPWAGTLPAEMLAPARRYLERLADEGVREGAR